MKIKALIGINYIHVPFDVLNNIYKTTYNNVMSKQYVDVIQRMIEVGKINPDYNFPNNGVEK